MRIFKRLKSETLKEMLEAKLDAHETLFEASNYKYIHGELLKIGVTKAALERSIVTNVLLMGGLQSVIQSAYSGSAKPHGLNVGRNTKL